MPSVWIVRRATKRATRFRVMYRPGGREVNPRYGGTFGTMREARIRRDWIAGELAALRMPDLTLLAEPPAAPTLAEVAERWQASRVDASENTRLNAPFGRCARCCRCSARGRSIRSRRPTCRS